MRYLEAVLDEEPLLSAHLLELAEWTAQYYLAPLGEVLRAMLPLAAEVRRTVYYRLTDLGRDVLAASMDGGPARHRTRPTHCATKAADRSGSAIDAQATGASGRRPRSARHGASGAGAAGLG